VSGVDRRGGGAEGRRDGGAEGGGVRLTRAMMPRIKSRRRGRCARLCGCDSRA
jgi:hypothetical protein